MSERPTIPMKPPFEVFRAGRTTTVKLMVRVVVRDGSDPWTWDWSKVDFSAVAPEGTLVDAHVYGGVDPNDERRVVTFRPNAQTI